MNKTIRYFILFLFSLVSAFPLFSQSTVDSSSSEKKSSKDDSKFYFIVKESFPKKFNGQIFLSDKWVDGTIVDFQNNTYKVSLRYRVANEEMQVQHNNKTKALQAPQIKEINLSQRIFISSYFMLNEEKFMSFFEVITDGKIKLLKQYEAKEKKGIYTIQSSFYSKKGKAPAEKITLKKKCIMELMQDQKGAIQRYIKKDKINLKKSDDVIKLFEFYNSL